MPPVALRKKVIAEVPDTEWLSVGQAARSLGIAYATVLSRVAQGKLDTTEFNGRVFVSRTSVERALQLA